VAAHNDDRELAAFLIDHGAKAGTANHYGITALALAAGDGSAPMVDLLLKAGADAKAATPSGETMLMMAARSGNPAVVKALLDHGADANAKENWEQETALMYAAAENHPDVVRLLIAHDADVNARSRATDPKAPRPRWPQNFGLHINNAGLTPLLFAARQGATESVRALVENNANPDLGDPSGITPMIMAIMNAQYDTAAALLKLGADPNASDSTGRSPLFSAVDMHKLEWLFSRPTPKPAGKMDSADMVKLLLERGANPNQRLRARATSFQHDTPTNANFIAGATPFLKAASASDAAMMRLLIEHGADPNLANNDGTTPLMAAAGLNWRDISSVGAQSETIEAIQVCLEHGADVNAVNRNGETPLHGAAQRGAESVVTFLASKGARLDAKNKEGRTPMDEALGEAGELADGAARRPERVETVAVLRKLLGQGGAQASGGGQ
jgi:ankyrin repeat protein